MQRYDAVVVGAGAAGLLCGGLAARSGLRVLILEHSDRPGRKLMITGKGRCNLTNDCDPDAFLRKVRTNPRFLYSALNAFPPRQTIAFFEELGVPLKTERGGRVFPVSDRSLDVVAALVAFATESGAELLRADCRRITLRDDRAAGVQCAGGQSFEAGAVVVATGGKSYPRTGSDGSGYRLAQGAGHTVIPPRPSLVPIETAEDWCAQLAGLSLKNVTLTLHKAGARRPVYSELGEMLFTHFGVSGPLVLTATSYMQTVKGFHLTIDLKPGLTHQQLDARLLRDFEARLNKNLANSLDELLPKSLIPVVIQLSGIAADTKINQLTRQQRQGLCDLIKALPVTPRALRPVEEAVVTAGGVAVNELDPRTMQSKLVQGLYFAGEVIDVDATTGGYNLQIAFSTAYLAAQALVNGADAAVQ